MRRKNEYFDVSYYGQQALPFFESLPRDLYAHYLEIGWQFGLDPHPNFSTNGYLSENPDVLRAGVNPLVHFEASGIAEQRKTVSVAEYENWPRSKIIIRHLELVNLDHYQSQVSEVRFRDVLAALDHYLEIGWRSGLDPHPSFSTRGYLHDNQDVGEDGVDPLTHFVFFGQQEGRSVVDPEAFAKPGYRTPDSLKTAEIRESLSEYLRLLGIEFEVGTLNFVGDFSELLPDLEWFDEEYYLSRYEDVAKASVPALAHFVLTGHREGRFPNSKAGEKFGLQPDIQRVLLARSWSEHSYDEVPESDVEVRTGSSVVAEMVDREMVSGSRLIVAFVHNDYVQNVGGIQIVAAQEEVMFSELGDSYISLFPSRPILALSPSAAEESLVQCRVAGVLIDGAFPLVDFARALAAHFSNHDVVFVLHSIFGHSPEAIGMALHELQPSVACWWVHDYSAHCQNYRLTRNEVNWCGDPAPESQSCRLCSYGPVRGPHVERVRSLLSKRDWVFAAPSELAADLSVAGNTPLPRRPLVIPHGQIRRDGSTREPCDANEKVRVAFVGHPAPIKGWDRFVAFVTNVGDHANSFDFFHLGIEDQSVSNVTFVEALPRPGGRSVVTQTLVDLRIDAVFNFADGRETFNFVTFEAMAAGTCVITSPRSGNVFIAALNEGLLIELEDDAMTFDYRSLRDEIREKRRSDLGEFQMSGLTPALLTAANR